MKRKDFERLLKDEGYQIVRSNGHITWGHPQGHTVAIPHGKELNKMVARRLIKEIAQSKNKPLVQVGA